MTLNEIDDSLPQGLHDSEVKKLAYDIPQQTVTLDFSVYAIEPDDKFIEGAAFMRDGRLIFDQALYFALDPPIELLNDQLHILSFEVAELTESGSPKPLPKGISLFKLFTQYRVIQIAAAEVRFEWIS
jgi:hypothetical protein